MNLYLTKSKHGIDGGHTLIAQVAVHRKDRSLLIHTNQNVTEDQFDNLALAFRAAPELLQQLEFLVGIICGGERDVSVEDCDDARQVIESAKRGAIE